MTSPTVQLDPATPGTTPHPTARPASGALPPPTAVPDAADLGLDLDLTIFPLVLEGELDSDSTERLRALLDDRMVSGHRLELDLSGVTHVSAAALAVLVGTHRKLRDRRGVLVLCAPSLAVQKVLRVSGLHRVFEIAAE